jgi:flagellar protein FlgJ
MDITALGSSYLQNSGLVPFSASSASVPVIGDSPADSFAGLLEKAQAQSVVESSPTTSRSAVIDKTDKLYEQCEALETFLVKNLISGMRKTVQKSDLLDTGFAGEMYEDMLYDEYAKDFSQNADLGFAELAYLELTGQRGKLIANHA